VKAALPRRPSPNFELHANAGHGKTVACVFKNRPGLKLSDIDVIELNEAFAAQSLAVIKEGAGTFDNLS
jgi:Thiolase, C-terminal domain